MDESDTIRIRDRYRLTVLENLCIYSAISQPVFAGQMTVDQSLGLILKWLEAQPARVSKLVGARLQDAGMTALYEGEAREATDAMKAIAQKIADDIQREA